MPYTESKAKRNSDSKTLVLPSRSLHLVDDKENNYNTRRIQKLEGIFFSYGVEIYGKESTRVSIATQ